VYSVGSGNQILSSSTVTLGTAGAGGDAGAAGAGGTPGAAGAAGTTNSAGRNGAAGNAGATRAGNPGNAGALGTRQARVHSNTAPTASAAVDRTTGRIPLEVQFSSAASVDPDGDIVAYSWNFGDGSPVSTEANPTHTYTTTGAKTAVLTVTDDSGATATSSVVVTPTQNQAPTAVANGTPLRGVFPLTVTFSSAGSVDADCALGGDCPGLSYSWDFGDGSPVSTDPNPVHIYEDPDTYTATLTVTDNEGATATATVSVNVRLPNLPPIAAAAGTPSSGKEPLTVSFTSAGTVDQELDGTIESYEWDFGDGNSSTSANPSHTYASAGTYVATLLVTDNDGGTSTASVVTTVDPNQSPTAAASASVTGGHAPLEVSFSSAASFDPDGTFDVEWDFGDGSPVSTEANPTHTYTNETSETIVRTATLTVTDDNGATSVATVTIDVWPENQAPTADAVAAPESGKTPLTVQFDGSASADADGTIASYEWDFGDGGSSTDAEPLYEFDTAGTYEVTLTVTDDDGATDTASVTISVVDNVAPTASAQVSPANGKAVFTTFEFDGAGSADSDGTIESYEWDFGDGITSSSVSPSHVYAAAGVYEATLTVTDDNGATDTDSVTVTVVDNVAPTAAAAATPTSGKTTFTTFQFSSAGSADSDGTIAAYSWDFGDGGPGSSAENPTKVFSAAGVYEVTLTVTDDNGATDTESVTVTVLDNVAPTTAPTVNLTSGTTATNFNFAANAADSDGTVTSVLWNFGNGTFASNANVSNKKFTAPGTYEVTVTVTDNNGAQTTSAPITITIS
jgi:PKD repeat protein